MRGIRAVRLGHGANCSSIGSVVDTLFLSAVAGSALFAAIAAAIAGVGGGTGSGAESESESESGSESESESGSESESESASESERAAVARYASWGAWVKIEEPAAIVALDRDGARAAGLDGAAIWAGDEAGDAGRPIEAHVAVTAKCAAGCEGCYLDARADGDEPPLATLLARLDAVKERGVLTVAFGGGEPLTRGDLAELARAARARGLTPVLTTSGFGLTDARVAELRGFAQVNVSYDGAPGEDGAYAAVRGFDGARAAEGAIARLARAGIAVGVNVVLTRASFASVEATVRRARELGAREAQLLRYKPAGRAATMDYLARRLTDAQARALVPTLRRLADEHAAPDARGVFHLRVDCALVPYFSADPSIDARALERLGIFGCEAADRLEAVRVDGARAPCSFAAPADDAEMRAWRAYVASPAEPCASCPLRAVCKGGCKVVARHAGGAHGPDPECPRVRAHRASAARGADEAAR